MGQSNTDTMGDVPPLGGLSVNDNAPQAATTFNDLPPDVVDAVLERYLEKIEVDKLCEARLLEICIALRGTDQCNDPNDSLWKAACARFGLTERLVGGVPGAPATPTWHVTFLAMCNEMAKLEPTELEGFKSLLRGDDARYTDQWNYTRFRGDVRELWWKAVLIPLRCMVHYLLRRVEGIANENVTADDYGIRSRWDDAPLLFASARDELAVVQELLAAGADVEGRGGEDYLTPLHAAVRFDNNPAIVEALVAAGAAIDEILYEASELGNLAIVEALLAGSSAEDINRLCKTYDIHTRIFLAGSTALMAASEHGHIEVVRALLAAGADVNGRDGDGNTALMYATESDHLEIVEVLRAAGGDQRFDAQTRYSRGKTMLMLASEKGRIEDVEAQLGAGADVDARSEFGQTALIYASQNGHLAVVEALISAGADVDAPEQLGDRYAWSWDYQEDYPSNTPLIYASRGGHLGVVEALLDAGADVDAHNRWGDTALGEASVESHTAIAELLRAAGATE